MISYTVVVLGRSCPASGAGCCTNTQCQGIFYPFGGNGKEGGQRHSPSHNEYLNNTSFTKYS